MVQRCGFMAVVRRTQQLCTLWFIIPCFTLVSCTTQALAAVLGREFIAYVDFSKSPQDVALRQGVDTLRASLPEIINAWNIVKIRIYGFGQNGWSPQETLPPRDLPLYVPPKPQQAAERKETDVLRNFANVREKQASTQFAEKEATAQREHHEAVDQVLSTIDHAAWLPPKDFPEPRCTDLNGLLKRIMEETVPSLVAIITDGDEDCTPPLKPVPPPKGGEIALVIILVPGKPKLRTVPHPKPGKVQHAHQPVPQLIEQAELEYQHVARRKTELAKAVPWAVVVPHFHKDLSQAFAEAAERMRTQHVQAAKGGAPQP